MHVHTCTCAFSTTGPNNNNERQLYAWKIDARRKCEIVWSIQQMSNEDQNINTAAKYAVRLKTLILHYISDFLM